MARAQPRTGPGQTQLSLGRPPERLAGLLRAQKQLLARIARKKKELARFDEQARSLANDLAAGVGPLVSACSALDEEIHGLFAKLLAPGRLAARSRKQVERLYRTLQNDGFLTSHDAVGADDGDDWPGGQDDGDGAYDEPPPHATGGFRAPRPGGKGPIESIRGIYRRLAKAIHPDKVQDEAERARRTEIMKDVTRAYGDGDLARLLEIERLWSVSAEPATATDDLAQRCEAQERTNAELRAQLRGIDAKLRVARRSPHGDLVRHRRSGGDPVGDLIADARTEHDSLTGVRDHVLAFERGSLSLADFLAGPGAADERDDLDALLRQAAAALAEFERAFAPRRRRPSARRR